jgi:aspartyl-tRNA(Asn)/glutamyl-tRNA(Gln) amidotransferase subunit B
MKSSWQPIIGIEVHFELKTESKMFCSCPAKHFGKIPNSQTCPTCLGLPGALPVPNQKAIEWTILVALGFDAKISTSFRFDRKNYFYPDLPKGYQISQHFIPIGVGGEVPVLVGERLVKIGLEEIHLEEDTGKLIHQNNSTLIDFNRSGVPLVEVVSKPQIKSPLEAKLYLKRIQQVARWLGVSDCDMEKGSMRCEANISLSRTGKLPPYKIELKNINSFRFVEKALEYEISRQRSLLEKGVTPKQETRGFDSKKGVTYIQRVKETASDYRYFPEPDIPEFSITKKQIEIIRRKIPPLPWQEEEFLTSKVGLGWQEAQTLVAKRELLQGFKTIYPLAKKQKIDLKKLASMIINRKINVSAKKPEEVLSQIKQLESFAVSGKILETMVGEVLKENQKAIKDFFKGKTQVIGFLVGQVQKKAKGQADPKETAKIIIDKLQKQKNNRL